MIYQLKYAAFFISYPLIINFIFNCETSESNKLHSFPGNRNARLRQFLFFIVPNAPRNQNFMYL
ncbi:hypothetical protein SAMN05216365_1282 [Porphyromonadaceae bacterium NLAE-zl-C104]|nr:hypothetical protein SAMN05216365_1282 [Porphyromonadaceae bacterium NLAE-zl-C104]